MNAIMLIVITPNVVTMSVMAPFKKPVFNLALKIILSHIFKTWFLISRSNSFYFLSQIFETWFVITMQLRGANGDILTVLSKDQLWYVLRLLQL
jgi:hypothetical protein